MWRRAFFSHSRLLPSYSSEKAISQPFTNNNLKKISVYPISKLHNLSNDVSSGDTNEILYRAIDILIKGHEKPVLDSYMIFMIASAQYLDIPVAGKLSPKFIADRSTFLKSIHIYKHHRVQYEIRTHRQVLQLKYLTGSTANVYLEYIERNIPAGVAMHVHKWQLQQLPEHIKERMNENLTFMSDKDWKEQANFIEYMKNERLSKSSDYEEYHTTKRFLLGTVM